MGEATSRKCPTCKGTGWYVRKQDGFKDECPDCEGTGKKRNVIQLPPPKEEAPIMTPIEAMEAGLLTVVQQYEQMGKQLQFMAQALPMAKAQVATLGRSEITDLILASTRGAYMALTSEASVGDAARAFCYTPRTLLCDAFEAAFHFARMQHDGEHVAAKGGAVQETAGAVPAQTAGGEPQEGSEPSAVGQNEAPVT